MKLFWLFTVILVLSFLSVACRTPPVVEKGRWVKVDGPKGTYLADLAVDPTNPLIVYAAIDGGGIYKSEDGGKTWGERNAGVTGLWAAWTIAIDSKDPQTLYVGAWGTGLFKSTNGGGSWNNILGSETGSGSIHAWDIVIAPTSPQAIYVGTSKGVFKSINGGKSWVPKNEGILYNRIFSIALDPADPIVLYGGTWGGATSYIFKSTDAGESWNVAYKGSENINTIAIGGSKDAGIVYAGTDTNVLKGRESDIGKGPSEISYLRDLTISPDNSEIYAATWVGLFRSSADGNSWDLLSGDFDTQIVKAVTLDPANSKNLYAGVWGGFIKPLMQVRHGNSTMRVFLRM